MSSSESILNTLTSQKISYEVLEHEPLLTMQDGLCVEQKLKIVPCKNLLLVNRQHEFFLLMISGDKRVKVNNIAKEINSSHLSFASDDDLKALFEAMRKASEKDEEQSVDEQNTKDAQDVEAKDQGEV